MDLQGERCLLLTANRNFFAIYTNKQQLHIFSSTTTELIKKGVVVEGVCMIESNQNNNTIALLTLKGNILVYKVINPDYPTIDSIRLEYKTSATSLLKKASADLKEVHEKEPTSTTFEPVHFKSMRLNNSGQIEAFLSNKERYHFDNSSI